MGRNIGKMNWSESFLNYAADLVKLYKTHPDDVMKSIGQESVYGSLIITYQHFVNEKEIPALENLADDHKQMLWLKSKEYSDDEKTRICICKALYLLDLLIK
jgi:hypothetical protein